MQHRMENEDPPPLNKPKDSSDNGLRKRVEGNWMKEDPEQGRRQTLFEFDFEFQMLLEFVNAKNRLPIFSSDSRPVLWNRNYLLRFRFRF